MSGPMTPQELRARLFSQGQPEAAAYHTLRLVCCEWRGKGTGCKCKLPRLCPFMVKGPGLDDLTCEPPGRTPIDLAAALKDPAFTCPDGLF